MQREIKEAGPLLDGRGRLREAGYSFAPILRYDGRKARSFPLRLKEWDFYQICDGEVCLQFTIGHASYMGQVGFTLFELPGERHYYGERRISRSITLPLPRSRLGMGGDSSASLSFEREGFRMAFKAERGRRELSFACPVSRGSPSIEASVELEEAGADSMVIATPFLEGPRYFYYNRKISGMRASGRIRIGPSPPGSPRGEETLYELKNGAFGLLDWGRGVWPFRHEWYWGSGAGDVDGQVLSFNIGSGFGDTSQATENMIFYGGKATKIGEIRIEPDEENRLAPWGLSSDDGRLELRFRPVFDNHTSTNILFVDNDCHQVFAKVDGRALLEDGRELRFEGLDGFCEHAVNRW